MNNTNGKATASHKRLAIWAVLLAGILGITTNAEAYLHPQTGRFVQRDPIGYADGMNLYEYVGSEPVGHVDWNGAAKKKSGTRPSDDPLSALSGATKVVREHARSYLKAPKEQRRFGSWQAKRGAIHFAMVLRKKMGDALPGALMVMDFVPDKDAGACCDKIDVLQFVHSLKDGKDFFTDPEKENKKRSYKGWHVDRITDKPGKSPYLTGQIKGANPGRTGKNAKPLIFGDAPWLNDQMASPSQLGQALVTCVACVKGPDAKKARGVDIYGCVAWGWSWRRRSRDRGEIFNVMGPRFNEKLPEPRATFGEVIKRWNKDSDPKHRIHYRGEVSTEKK